MYDESLYEYDKSLRMEDARLLEGAYLYRLTSINHNQVDEILNGRGPIYCPNAGRFHGPSQTTSYCSNNLIVCLAEVLFHNYDKVLDRIEKKLIYSEVCSPLEEFRSLVIVRVKEISNLVFFDCNSVKINYDNRIAGTMAVNPHPTYAPFRHFSDMIRSSKRRGVIYPSARHSKDFCIAFFEDETSRVIPETYYSLAVKLSLISEKQKPSTPLLQVDPFIDKLHPTMAHYSFEDEDEYERIKEMGIINPVGLPKEGMIDFVRRIYVNYPLDAVL